uniref:Uncharacterized protein n=1 Tax=Nicotiana tabacum TaxID=4097 RepID=A0A1S4A1E3_TOBAC|nr:PREDICTED: uncharacterized protein LOC107792733 [Nicotiana tabacum]
MEAAGTSRITELHELDEFRYHAFESTRLYKERMKIMHGKNIQGRIFKPGDVVLLYNSRLKLFLGIESKDRTNKFRVNGQRLKHYLGIEEEKVVSVIHLKKPQLLSEP